MSEIRKLSLIQGASTFLMFAALVLLIFPGKPWWLAIGSAALFGAAIYIHVRIEQKLGKLWDTLYDEQRNSAKVD